MAKQPEQYLNYQHRLGKLVVQYMGRTGTTIRAIAQAVRGLPPRQPRQLLEQAT